MDQTDITLSLTGTDSLVQSLDSLFLENMWEISCMHPKVEPNTQIADIGLDDGHGVDGLYFFHFADADLRYPVPVPVLLLPEVAGQW